MSDISAELSWRIVHALPENTLLSGGTSEQSVGPADSPAAEQRQGCHHCRHRPSLAVIFISTTYTATSQAYQHIQQYKQVTKHSWAALISD